MRIAEFILRDEGPEARGKELLAFSLKSTGGGRSSNLFPGIRYCGYPLSFSTNLVSWDALFKT